MTDNAQFIQIMFDKIRPSRWQPRLSFDPEALCELARSIVDNGLINHPLVFQVDSSGAPYRDSPIPPSYEIVAGERRIRALAAIEMARRTDLSLEDAVNRLAGHGIAPITLDGFEILCRLETGGDLTRLHRLAVVENLDRDNLSPIEEAQALQGLVTDLGLSQRELAHQINRSQGWISQRLALLNLDDTAREAVITRVITPTHARAIAGLAPDLQPSVTEWVKRDGDQITTRELEKATRELARFTDPNRWTPNPNTVYDPRVRNSLHFIRWLFDQVDLTAHAAQILKLRENYHHGNILAKQATTIAGSGHLIKEIRAALGFDGSEKLRERFALETGRICEQCRFAEYTPPSDLAISYYCPAWGDAERVFCNGFIGADDPVVIPVDYQLLNLAREEMGTVLQEKPFNYLPDIFNYIRAYNLAARAQRLKKQKAEDKEKNAHLDPIFAYINWQTNRPPQDLEHFQAHACYKCRHYFTMSPPWEGTDENTPELTRCHFLLNPLEGYGDTPRSPYFSVLVTSEGQVLPRCERFSYRLLPPLHLAPGTQLPDRDQALRWLRKLASHSASYSYVALYGVLAWLPCDRDPTRSGELDKAVKWIRDHWEATGMDAAIPVLLDTAISEATVISRYSRESIKLLNPSTGQEERFATCGFQYLTGTEWASYKGWPQGFPRPWELPGETPSAAEATETNQSIAGD
jgi:ParB family chromosome partitioning protein